MADDKSNAGGRDRATVSGSEAYEVDHFAKRHGITAVQAKTLIEKHGNNRATLDAEAAKLGKK